MAASDPAVIVKSSMADRRIYEDFADRRDRRIARGHDRFGPVADSTIARCSDPAATDDIDSHDFLLLRQQDPVTTFSALHRLQHKHYVDAAES